MGNLCARRSRSPPSSPRFDEENPAPGDAKDAEPEKKLDPKDFWVRGEENKVILREPGKIDGQQFIIEECKNCDIFLLDNSAQVTVDLCENCRVFIGPCESSVFLRDCKNCQWVIACQQLRLRDCENMDILVYISAGQPSIETSKNIRFGCFSYNYFGLKKQFEAAKLPVWNSEWSSVHDFNAKDEEQHWSFLPPSTSASTFLKPLSEVSPNFAPEEEKVSYANAVVPVTYGTRPYPQNEVCFVLVFSSYHEKGFELLANLEKQLEDQSLYLVRTRETALNSANAKSLFDNDKRLCGAAEKGSVVGLHFDGVNSQALISAAASGLVAQSAMFVSPAGQGDSFVTKFFDEMKPVM